MVTINDLPEHPGRLVFTRRRNLREQITIGGGVVDWKNVVIVDPDGGGDFTDIQSAIDSITTASNGDEYLVLIMGGDATTDYTITGAITLKDFVHLKGIGPRVPAVVITTSGATPGIDSVGTTHIENILFSFGGSGSIAIRTNSTHAETRFKNCVISGQDGVVANAGVFENCRFTMDIIVGGHATNHEDSPRFDSCRFNGSYIITTAAVNSTGQFTGCHIASTRKDTDTVEEFMNIDSPDVLFTGCTITTQDGPIIETSGAHSGCMFFMDKGGENTFTLTGQAKFSGCTFHFTGNTSGSNNALFDITSSAGGPNVISGCVINSTEGEVFQFSNGFTSDSWPGLILTGNTIRASTGGNGFLFDVHSSGCSGNPVVELSGNIIHAGFTLLQLANSGSGEDIKLRGSDVRTLWFPVDSKAGTAGAIMGVLTVGQLTAQNDVAYISGRVPPPVNVDTMLSTQLVVASDVGLEEDTFTDTDGTNLTAHTSDSGGSWTAQSGAITILSNQAQINASEIYTYSVTSVDGFLRMSFNNTAGSGTRSAFLVFRWADSSNYWFVEWSRNTGSVKLFKNVASSITEMGEADLDFSTTMTVGVSFINDHIIVYTKSGASPSNLIPVIRVEDSALNTNSTVGIGGRGNSVVKVDDFKFYPSRDADVTVSVEMAHEGEPFDNQSLSQTFSAGGGTAMPSVHETPTHIDIDTALDDIEQSAYVSAEVKLDSAALGGNLYVLGIMIQYLHFAFDFRGDTSERQYRPWR